MVIQRLKLSQLQANLLHGVDKRQGLAAVVDGDRDAMIEGGPVQQADNFYSKSYNATLGGQILKCEQEDVAVVPPFSTRRACSPQGKNHSTALDASFSENITSLASQAPMPVVHESSYLKSDTRTWPTRSGSSVDTGTGTSRPESKSSVNTDRLISIFLASKEKFFKQ
jgi:hypothetical protein